MRALPRLSLRPTAAAQPCGMPAAPLAPVRAEAGRAVLIGACMAALGRTHHGGLRIESKSGQLRRYLSALQCRSLRGEARVVQMQHQVSLVAMQLCGPRLVADVARLAGAHLQQAQRSATRWPHPEPSDQPAEERARSFDAIRSAPHRSEGSRGSTQAGKLITWGRRATGVHKRALPRRLVGTGVGPAHLIG
jgi:hypothetical protein